MNSGPAGALKVPSQNLRPASGSLLQNVFLSSTLSKSWLWWPIGSGPWTFFQLKQKPINITDQHDVGSSDSKMSSTQVRAHSCLCFIFRLTCRLKLVPYFWDSKTQRLGKVNRLGLLVFHIIAGISPISCAFMIVRYLQAQSQNPPPRIRVMNIIWGLAYALVFLCKVQLMVRAKEIMAFGNAMLEAREKALGLGKQAGKEQKPTTSPKMADPQKQNPPGSDWTSMIIFLGTFLLFMNPPLHAVVLLDTPCAPQYLSSLVLPCKWMGDSPVPLIQITPYLLWEYFAITDMMTIIAFLWGIIFMGLNWIKEEVMSMMDDEVNVDGGSDYMAAVAGYRRVQVLTRFVNDAFNLYLQYWPSLIYLIGGTMLFAAIRFTHLSLHIFLVFPACGIRCILEITTQMEAAANVNLASEKYLEKLESQARAAVTNRQPQFAQYLTKFRKSCTKLTCNAGSLYSLEKKIVLCSLDHCTQLVFNLLVAFPNAEEGNWGQKLMRVQGMVNSTG